MIELSAKTFHRLIKIAVYRGFDDNSVIAITEMIGRLEGESKNFAQNHFNRMRYGEKGLPKIRGGKMDLNG